MDSTGGYIMDINQDLLVQAIKIVEDKTTSLPTEIPGFPGLFVAEADDSSIVTMTGFAAGDSSYKIGTLSR